jgi:hypothetical protein
MSSEVRWGMRRELAWYGGHAEDVGLPVQPAACNRILLTEAEEFSADAIAAHMPCAEDMTPTAFEGTCPGSG